MADVGAYNHPFKRYTIPRKERRQSEDCQYSLPVNSREAKEIENAVKRLTWETSDMDRAVDISHIKKVDNPALEREYQEKKADLREEGRSPKELTEQLAFRVETDTLRVKEICQTGLGCDGVDHALGDGGMGVSVWRCPDLCLKGLVWPSSGLAYLVIFKIVKGRVKFVTPQVCPETPSLEPTPNYDCHISRNTAASSSTDLPTLMRGTQYYLYEYNEEGLPSVRPRHCLPFAVIPLKKTNSADNAQNTKPLLLLAEKPPSPVRVYVKSVEDSKTPSFSDEGGILAWRGLVTSNEKNLGWVTLMAGHKLGFNFWKSYLDITRKIPFNKLEVMLPGDLRSAWKKPLQYRNHVISLCTMKTSPGQPSAEFTNFTRNLATKAKAGGVVCIDPATTMFLVPSSTFSIRFGFCEAKEPPRMFCAVCRRQSSPLSPRSVWPQTSPLTPPPPDNRTANSTNSNAALQSDDSSPLKTNSLNFTAQHRAKIVVSSSEKHERVRSSPKHGPPRHLIKRSLSFSCSPGNDVTRSLHQRVSRSSSTGGSVGCHDKTAAELAGLRDGSKASTNAYTSPSDGPRNDIGMTSCLATSEAEWPRATSCRQSYAEARLSSSRDLTGVARACSNMAESLSPTSCAQYLKHWESLKKICKNLSRANGGVGDASMSSSGDRSTLEVAAPSPRDSDQASVTVTSCHATPVILAAGSCDPGGTCEKSLRENALGSRSKEESACSRTDNNISRSVQSHTPSDHSFIDLPRRESPVTPPRVEDPSSSAMSDDSSGWPDSPPLSCFSGSKRIPFLSDSPVEMRDITKGESPVAPPYPKDSNNAKESHPSCGLDSPPLNCYMKSDRIPFLYDSPISSPRTPEQTEHVDLSSRKNAPSEAVICSTQAAVQRLFDSSPSRDATNSRTIDEPFATTVASGVACEKPAPNSVVSCKNDDSSLPANNHFREENSKGLSPCSSIEEPTRVVKHSPLENAQVHENPELHDNLLAVDMEISEEPYPCDPIVICGPPAPLFDFSVVYSSSFVYKTDQCVPTTNDTMEWRSREEHACNAMFREGYARTTREEENRRVLTSAGSRYGSESFNIKTHSASFETSVPKNVSRQEAQYVDTYYSHQFDSHARDTNETNLSRQPAWKSRKVNTVARDTNARDTKSLAPGTQFKEEPVTPSLESRDIVEAVDMDIADELPDSSIVVNEENKSTERLEGDIHRVAVGRCRDTTNVRVDCSSHTETSESLPSNPDVASNSNPKSKTESTSVKEQDESSAMAEKTEDRRDSRESATCTDSSATSFPDRKRRHETSSPFEETVSDSLQAMQDSVFSSSLAGSRSRYGRPPEKRCKTVSTYALAYRKVFGSSVVPKPTATCKKMDGQDPFGFDGDDHLDHVNGLQSRDRTSFRSKSASSKSGASSQTQNEGCPSGRVAAATVNIPSSAHTSEMKGSSHKLTPNSYKKYVDHLSTLKRKDCVRKINFDESKRGNTLTRDAAGVERHQHGLATSSVAMEENAALLEQQGSLFTDGAVYTLEKQTLRERDKSKLSPMNDKLDGGAGIQRLEMKTGLEKPDSYLPRKGLCAGKFDGGICEDRTASQVNKFNMEDQLNSYNTAEYARGKSRVAETLQDVEIETCRASSSLLFRHPISESRVEVKPKKDVNDVQCAANGPETVVCQKRKSEAFKCPIEASDTGERSTNALESTVLFSSQKSLTAACPPVQDTKLNHVASQAKEPMTFKFPAKEPITCKFPAKEPMTAKLPAKKPITFKFLFKEPMTFKVPAKEPMTANLPAKEPMTVKLHAKEPTTIKVPVKEPMTAKLPANEPIRAVLLSKDPVAAVLSAEEPMAYKFPAKEPITFKYPAKEPMTVKLPAEEPIAVVLPAEEPVAWTCSVQEPRTIVRPSVDLSGSGVCRTEEAVTKINEDSNIAEVRQNNDKELTDARLMEEPLDDVYHAEASEKEPCSVKQSETLRRDPEIAELGPSKGSESETAVRPSEELRSSEECRKVVCRKVESSEFKVVYPTEEPRKTTSSASKSKTSLDTVQDVEKFARSELLVGEASSTTDCSEPGNSSTESPAQEPVKTGSNQEKQENDSSDRYSSSDVISDVTVSSETEPAVPIQNDSGVKEFDVKENDSTTTESSPIKNKDAGCTAPQEKNLRVDSEPLRDRQKDNRMLAKDSGKRKLKGLLDEPVRKQRRPETRWDVVNPLFSPSARSSSAYYRGYSETDRNYQQDRYSVERKPSERARDFVGRDREPSVYPRWLAPLINSMPGAGQPAYQQNYLTKSSSQVDRGRLSRLVAREPRCFPPRDIGSRQAGLFNDRLNRVLPASPVLPVSPLLPVSPVLNNRETFMFVPCLRDVRPVFRPDLPPTCVSWSRPLNIPPLQSVQFRPRFSANNRTLR